MNMPDLQVVRTITPLDPATLDEPVGAPALPTDDYFDPPADLPDDAKITVDFETGKVYGRVAPRKQCLLSRPGECWTISDSPTKFRGAMQGDTVLADGRVIRTANIGGAVRHAPDGRGGTRAYSFAEAVDWYENTASRLMRVRFGADEHGIWLAGALLPHVTKRQALDIMQSPVSGDWRWRTELDDYDMTGVVLVNMPGFPLGVKARAASAWGDPLVGTWDEVVAMVASLDAPDATVGDVPAADPEPTSACACGGHSQIASPAGDTVSDATATPEYVTKTDAEQIAADAVAAAVAAVREEYDGRFGAIEGTVGVLNEIAAEALDARVGAQDVDSI